MSYVVFRAVKSNSSEPLTEVTRENIETALKDSETWIELMNQAEDSASSEMLGKLRNESEPHLIQYVITELNRPMEDGVELEDDQKGETFFILKTVISSLAGRAA